jgi:hypothetical protein
MNRLKTRAVGFSIVLLILGVSIPAEAGVPEPPMLIFGTLQTSGGLPVTSGELRFDFLPVGGGTTVRVNALVGSLSSQFNFVAIVANERTPLDQADAALELGAGKTYTPRAYYNGIQLTPVQIESPLTPDRAKIIGPITYTVNPTGTVLSVSHDIDFGYVPVGSTKDLTFQISSVGTAAITGVATLDQGVHFSLWEGGIQVNEVAFNLDAGQSTDVTVRFAPGVVDSNLSDIFRVTSDGGEATRSVTGNSSEEEPTGDPDINGDGEVDELDLFIFMRNWLLQVPTMPDEAADLDLDSDADQDDLLKLMRDWPAP